MRLGYLFDAAYHFLIRCLGQKVNMVIWGKVIH